ncbi:MAG TPA: hypothetical protein PKD55_02565 [Bellilinea sp.]|nr:hypothetical protein [Bellilinea sp.]
MSICVEDFCGTQHGTSISTGFWADWFEEDQMTRFGGHWSHVPPMPSQTCPTSEQVHEWADRYGGYEEGIRLWLLEEKE